MIFQNTFFAIVSIAFCPAYHHMMCLHVSLRVHRELKSCYPCYKFRCRTWRKLESSTKQKSVRMERKWGKSECLFVFLLTNLAIWLKKSVKPAPVIFISGYDVSRTTNICCCLCPLVTAVFPFVRKNWTQTWTVLHGGVLTFHKDPKSAAMGTAVRSVLCFNDGRVSVFLQKKSWAQKIAHPLLIKGCDTRMLHFCIFRILYIMKTLDFLFF